MSLFIGGHRNEIITPEKVSSSVFGFFHRKPTAGADLIFAGGGDDIVAGGGGNDLAFLGRGDDRFIWNPGDGSDFVDGGRGSDTLEFNGSDAQADTIRLEDEGGLAELDRNFGGVKMTLHRMERVEIATAGGADRIIIDDIAATDVREVAIDLAGAANADSGDGFNDIVQLHGSAESDVIEIVGEDGSLAVVGLPAFVTIANAEATDQVRIIGGDGDDQISAATLRAGSVQLTLDGGAGNDTVFGSAGADTLLGSEGNDVVNGGRGDDYALLGAGNDVFVWNPGDGSDVIDGGTAFDEMTFNGSGANETIDISADGAGAIFFRDVGNVALDTIRVEIHHFNALGGADTVVVNDLSGTDVQHVGVELGGDGQADTIVANGSAADEIIQIATGEGEILASGLSAQVHVFGQDADGRDRLQVNGADGDDVIDASMLAANAVEFTARGGQGHDVLVGSDGDDVLEGGDGDDVLIGGDGDDVLDGGAGDDLLIGGLGDDVIIAGEGDDIEVEGFIAGAGSEDRIDVRGLGVDFDWLVANATDSDAGVVLDLGGHHLTLRGVSLYSLHQDDFLV